MRLPISILDGHSVLWQYPKGIPCLSIIGSTVPPLTHSMYKAKPKFHQRLVFKI
jgi:hypothetical protein